jgi:ABC-2 type transport system ATP-binding protein
MAAGSGIEVRDLRVLRGGRPVLDGLSLTIAPGKVTGLLGPSGCGKSTLLRAIAGVQLIASGAVTVLGQPAGSRPLRSRVGYVTQLPAIYHDLTVAQNLRYFQRLYGVETGRVRAVLETVQLEQQANQLVRDLSGGQLARAVLGSAILHEPEVLILDEPTVGLDPVLRKALWQTFHEFSDRGALLLVSSHVMDEAERCDDLLLMRDGVIIASSTPAAILRQTAATSIEEAFLRLVEAEEGVRP